MTNAKRCKWVDIDGYCTLSAMLTGSQLIKSPLSLCAVTGANNCFNKDLFRAPVICEYYEEAEND